METKFKKGQFVECLVWGAGVVTEIKSDENFKGNYPVIVKFVLQNNSLCFMEYVIVQYTADGRLEVNANITLTTGTWKKEEILPEPTFEKGQPVWVRDDDDEEWKLRYYSHKEQSKHHSFSEQNKNGRTVDWKYVKPFEGVDPNE